MSAFPCLHPDCDQAAGDIDYCLVHAPEHARRRAEAAVAFAEIRALSQRIIDRYGKG